MTSPEAFTVIETPAAILHFYDSIGDIRPVYALIPAIHRGKWVWGRKAEQDTWEFPGGHLESGESEEAAARRELEEESGAEEYSLEPLAYYSVSPALQGGGYGPPVYGRLFLANVTRFGPLRHEIVETRLFEGLPEKLSYPDIQPHLMRFAMARKEGR